LYFQVHQNGYRANLFLATLLVISGFVEKLALIGLPNSGKSSLFKALTSKDVLIAPHLYSTASSNLAVAEVYDERLENLSKLSNSKKTVRAGFELFDIANDSRDAGLKRHFASKYFAECRTADALCYVLRAFEDEAIVGESDPLEAFESIQLEVIMSDLEIVESTLTRQLKAEKAKKTSSKITESLEAAKGHLELGTPLYMAMDFDEYRDTLRDFGLLSLKKVIAVLNVNIQQTGTISHPAADLLNNGKIGVILIDAKLEAEATELEESERKEFYEVYGLKESLAAAFSKMAYDILGKWTFFTTGEKESRAWTFTRGFTAPECAGIIHTDLKRGFIRAEVISYDDLMSCGSVSKARSLGKVRLEGKDYVVKDGDVLEIRFNV
jgi:GTP-binding protein YchF